MKRYLFKLFLSIFICCAMFVTAVACENNPVEDIEITAPPSKTQYVEGEMFSTSGMEVSLVMKNGEKVVITDFTVDKTEPLALTDTEVTISYGDFSKTISITVIASDAVTGIEISTQPTKKAYVVGETFNSAGMVVKKVLGNGTKVAITDYTISKTTALALTDTTITISYQGFNATVAITVTAPTGPVTLEDIELDVDVGWDYVRTMEVSSHIKYRQVMSDGSKGLWEDVAEDDLTYAISADKVTVTVKVHLNNTDYTKSIEVPFEDHSVTVTELMAMEVGEETAVEGIIVAIAAIGASSNEVVLLDPATGTMIGVKNLTGAGTVREMTVELNGLEVGDRIIVPVKLVQTAEGALNADSLKVYADFTGGRAMNTAVVSKNNSYDIAKDSATMISNQEELRAFLTTPDRSEIYYQFVKLHGKVNYIYYSATESQMRYRFFFDGVTSLAQQTITGNCSPVFTNGTQFYTTGNTIGEMIFDDAEYKPTTWATPGSAIKDIYALYIGGNTYYHDFVILEEEDVQEVTPLHVDTVFTAPAKDTYKLNDTLSIAGGKITAVYDYGNNIDIDLQMGMLDPSTIPSMTEAGPFTIAGSYNGFDFSFDITVLDKSAESIELIGTIPSTFHYRDSEASLLEIVKAQQLKVYYDNSTDEIISITDGMISLSKSWDGIELDDTLQINFNYLDVSLVTPITVTAVLNPVSISQFKTFDAGDTVYDISGIVVSSVFISGSISSLGEREILLMDSVTKEVIGLKGITIDRDENKLAGLSVGDEILVKVTKVVTSTTATHSEQYKQAASAVDTDIVVLRQENDVMLDLSSAVLIDDQTALNNFLKDSTTRKENAYKLIKLTAGAKLANTSVSQFITFTATSSDEVKIDGRQPYLHELNQPMTLGDKTYSELLFDGEAGVGLPTGRELAKDVYLLYVGGQGIYYHQFVLLGEEYVIDAPTPILRNAQYTAPSKKLYEPGDELDFDGGMVELTYNYSGHNKIVQLTDAHINIEESNFDMAVNGNYTIVFEVEGLTFEYDFTVKNAALVGIEIGNDPTITTYGHRDGFDDIDVTGGTIKLIYDDGSYTFVSMEKSMLVDPGVERADGVEVVQYSVVYGGFTAPTTISITYENRGISVAEFLTKPNSITYYDVTGIVVNSISAHSFPELLIKDENSNAIVGIIYTGLTNAANLTISNAGVAVGDRVIVSIRRAVHADSAGGGQGKLQGSGGAASDFKASTIIVESGVPITYDLTDPEIVTIATQDELVAFLNSADRFYKYVRLVNVKGVVNGEANNYRIFFHSPANLAAQQINEDSPYLYNVNYTHITGGTLLDKFNNSLDGNNTIIKDYYSNPSTAKQDIYAVLTGGNTYYHSFSVLSTTMFGEPYSPSGV